MKRKIQKTEQNETTTTLPFFLFFFFFYISYRDKLRHSQRQKKKKCFVVVVFFSFPSCVCVCVCVRALFKEGERQKEPRKERAHPSHPLRIARKARLFFFLSFLLRFHPFSLFRVLFRPLLLPLAPSREPCVCVCVCMCVRACVLPLFELFSPEASRSHVHGVVVFRQQSWKLSPFPHTQLTQRGG